MKKRCISILLVLIMVLSLLPFQAFATTVSVLDGQVSVTDTANNCTVSDGVVTIKAAGSLFSKKTNTVTVTNESGNKAQLSFAYAASTYNSFTVDGASASASGNYSGILEAGGTATLVLVSNNGLSNTTATLTLSNFSLTAAAEASDVTFNYDSALGSVTVDGATIANGNTVSVPISGATLVATANSGSTFLGWVNSADGTILSTAASHTLTPAAAMTVEAVFVGAGSKPYFMIGAMSKATFNSGHLNLSSNTYYTVPNGTHLFDDLNEAANAAAASAGSKAVVLMNSGTLTAGTYTIPAGVTLLVPFNTSNTLYTTAPQHVTEDYQTDQIDYVTPTAYRTLTMADGANLVINGAMSLSGQHRYTNGSRESGGSPVGPVGFVRMNSGSNITVNNGGVLYAYGFITGAGTVTAKNGGSVYELFQIMDFRGGTQSTSMEGTIACRYLSRAKPWCSYGDLQVTSH